MKPLSFLWIVVLLIVNTKKEVNVVKAACPLADHAAVVGLFFEKLLVEL